MTDNRNLTLTLYAVAFMTSISLFGLVDAVSADAVETAAVAVTRAFLLPILGIAALCFLIVTLIMLTRGHLRGTYVWNTPKAERQVLELGIGAASYFGVLALISFALALIAPSQMAATSAGMAEHWPWFLAVPCLAIGAAARQNKPSWLVAGAIFATIGLFT
ncbi:MAG: hypothetical protein DI616_15205 [Paracoccus denitrificans]|uniref:Uncharacterized protein n=1 Tax=Paracoccus denitrificans TaxID=266 RepID=A0A533I0R3_PARDE|nr:MAG: hypothetical protein DI616_15205 [Paracoccus denitrificans]